ncbi:MAG: hypothetical protein FD171_855 [Actinobacteria bacterium]|nr:MAG: hypothetical protein FD171_855 [Actinomycetota bacterium]
MTVVTPVLVLDASVGVKWLRDEVGSVEARALLERHSTGEIQLVAPVIFIHEVLDVARRLYGVDAAAGLGKRLSKDEIIIVGLDAGLTDSTLQMCRDLGCTFYDAAAPALARRLDATLVSADRAAHGCYEGVSLLG